MNKIQIKVICFCTLLACSELFHSEVLSVYLLLYRSHWIPGGGTLGISGWGYAAGTLEPLTYTRPSTAEFCYPILGVNSPNPPYPRVAASLV